MNLVRLLNLRFLNELAATNDRNLKFAALADAFPLSKVVRGIAALSVGHAAAGCLCAATPCTTTLRAATLYTDLGLTHSILHSLVGTPD
jgi:hypothetical protein